MRLHRTRELLMRSGYLLLAVVLAPRAVFAADDRALEDVLVTGTYSPAPELTASVSVLDSAEIDALNKEKDWPVKNFSERTFNLEDMFIALLSKDKKEKSLA